MKDIIEIPQTPRMAFDALTGKRPDLMLTATRGSIAAIRVRLKGGEKFAPNLEAIAGIIGTVKTGELHLLGGIN